MNYKPYYSDVLLLSSMFYFHCALIDFFITLYAYASYGNLFFHMELNPFIRYIVKLGIPPLHMVIMPVIIAFLCLYFRHLADKVNKESVISDRIIWGMGFAICLITMMGILHLLGFYSWFYHGMF